MKKVPISKSAVRNKIWARLKEKKLARFPFPIDGRIPNFKGAEAAARLLAEQPFYKKSRFLKCNPDCPQLPVRRQALEDGKTIFMAVPRLRSKKCFIRLDPANIPHDQFRKAASISGSKKFGVPILPEGMPKIDLIVTGSVAVRKDGGRVGKGGGYSDLEFGISRELKLVTDKTLIITTVHDEQVVDDPWTLSPYDIPLDWILTPSQTLTCRPRLARPIGILWDELDTFMRESIPILDSFR